MERITNSASVIDSILSFEGNYVGLTLKPLEYFEERYQTKYSKVDYPPLFKHTTSFWYDARLLGDSGLFNDHNLQEFTFEYYVPSSRNPMIIVIRGLEPLKIIVAPRWGD